MKKDQNKTDNNQTDNPVLFDSKGRNVQPISVRVGKNVMSFDDWCRDYCGKGRGTDCEISDSADNADKKRNKQMIDKHIDMIGRNKSIFNEWARMYADDPESFSDILDENGNAITDYGINAANTYAMIESDLIHNGVISDR